MHISIEAWMQRVIDGQRSAPDMLARTRRRRERHERQIETDETHTHTCTHTHRHTETHTRTHTCTQTRTHMCTQTCTLTHRVFGVDVDAIAEVLLHLRQLALRSGDQERAFRLPHGVRRGE